MFDATRTGLKLLQKTLITSLREDTLFCSHHHMKYIKKRKPQYPKNLDLEVESS